MIARELLATANIPAAIDLAGDTEGALQLYRRGDDFMITIGNNELMNSRVYGSEQALAELSCAAIKNISSPHILIGGYGMGFTLRSALNALGEDAHIIIAELIPDIIEWAKGPMKLLTQNALDDNRVSLRIADVRELIIQGKEGARFDAILLDVDNGPDGLTKADNDSLYSESGLMTAKSALNSGGILAIWSAHPSSKFTKQLKQCGFKTCEHIVRARTNGKGARHTIWIAKKL